MSQQVCDYSPTHRCPVESQSEQLLIEFRAFRDQMIEWREDNGERLTEVEVKSKDISGNGRPGRMKEAENAIASLQRDRYWIFGAAAGISSLAAAIFEVVRLKVGH